MNIKGIYYTIASALLFGITPLLARLIYDLGANSLTVVFYRSLLVVLLLALIMYIKKISFRIDRKSLRYIAITSLFGSGLTTLLLFSSYEYIDTGTATNLHFLYPIFVALGCRFLYHEKLAQKKLISLLLAFLGMALFLSNSQSTSLFGVGIAIASSITYAFYMLCLEKSGLAKMNGFKLSFYIGCFITMETLLYHMFQPTIVWSLPPLAFFYLFLIAICSSFLGVIWLQKGILLLGSGNASLFCLFEPITSLVVGVIFLQEDLSLIKVCGTLCILISLIQLVYVDYKTKKCNS